MGLRHIVQAVACGFTFYEQGREKHSYVKCLLIVILSSQRAPRGMILSIPFRELSSSVLPTTVSTLKCVFPRFLPTAACSTVPICVGLLKHATPLCNAWPQEHDDLQLSKVRSTSKRKSQHAVAKQLRLPLVAPKTKGPYCHLRYYAVSARGPIAKLVGTSTQRYLPCFPRSIYVPRLDDYTTCLHCIVFCVMSVCDDFLFWHSFVFRDLQ